MGGLLDRLADWVRPSEDAYDVEEYVLARVEPDPENRLEVFDEPVEPATVEADAELSPGVYLLQEVKASGMAGEVVWETELGGGEAGE